MRSNSKHTTEEIASYILMYLNEGISFKDKIIILEDKTIQEKIKNVQCILCTLTYIKRVYKIRNHQSYSCRYSKKRARLS